MANNDKLKIIPNTIAHNIFPDLPLYYSPSQTYTCIDIFRWVWGAQSYRGIGRETGKKESEKEREISNGLAPLALWWWCVWSRGVMGRNAWLEGWGAKGGQGWCWHPKGLLESSRMVTAQRYITTDTSTHTHAHTRTHAHTHTHRVKLWYMKAASLYLSWDILYVCVWCICLKEISEASVGLLRGRSPVRAMCHLLSYIFIMCRYNETELWERNEKRED